MPLNSVFLPAEKAQHLNKTWVGAAINGKSPIVLRPQGSTYFFAGYQRGSHYCIKHLDPYASGRTAAEAARKLAAQ